MTTATALVLIGIGALVVANCGEPRAPSLRAHADALRRRTREAQQDAAHSSLRARDLAERWSVAEDAARRQER